jgi:hypothetical protein
VIPGSSGNTVVHGGSQLSVLPPFHGGNRGSNPLGDANRFNTLGINNGRSLSDFGKFQVISE